MLPQKGFSLIEILIVVIIIGILAGMALPGFLSQTQRANRADVKTQLMDFQARFERCYTGTFSYQNCNATILNNNVNYPSDANNLYVISANTTAQTYTITATATAGQRQIGDSQFGTACTVLTVDNTGNQTPIDCW